MTDTRWTDPRSGTRFPLVRCGDNRGAPDCDEMVAEIDLCVACRNRNNRTRRESQR